MEASTRKTTEAQSAAPVPAMVAMKPPRGAPMTIIPRFTDRTVALTRAMSLSGVTARRYPVYSGPSTPVAMPKSSCPVPARANAAHSSPDHCSAEP